MSTTNLRRRLHHGDVDGRKNEHVDISSADSLNEPLLGKSSGDNFGSAVSLFFWFTIASILSYSSLHECMILYFLAMHQ